MITKYTIIQYHIVKGQDKVEIDTRFFDFDREYGLDKVRVYKNPTTGEELHVWRDGRVESFYEHGCWLGTIDGKEWKEDSVITTTFSAFFEIISCSASFCTFTF